MDIYCLEGNWSPDLQEEESVRPMLEVLRDSIGMRFIHQRIAVPEAFEHATKIWRQKRYARYRIGYFAFHGRPGQIKIEGNALSLRQLARWLGPVPGRVIHLSGCSILKGKSMDEDANEFLRVTRASALSGYQSDVEWIDSLAFEILLLAWMNEHPRRPEFGIAEAVEQNETLALRDLKFVVYPKNLLS